MLEAPVKEHLVELSITQSARELAFLELSIVKLKTIRQLTEVSQQTMSRDIDDQLK